MSLEELKFLFCWVKKQAPDNDELKWVSSPDIQIPIIWEFIESCHSGEFFLKILMNVDPSYFFLPCSGDLVHSMFKQIKKFLNDHFCVPENMLGRLNMNFNDEMAKWELCELIFFISFLCRSDCDGVLEDIHQLQEGFTLALKISLGIIMRTLGKMKIMGNGFFEVQSRPVVNFTEFSSSKKRRQEELLKENNDQRSFIHDLKGKNKALEEEIMNLKNSSGVSEFLDENSDSKYLNKIYMLEKRVNKSQDLIDDKNREIITLKKENEKLQDSIEDNLMTIKKYESQLLKSQEINKKAEKLSILEEKLKTYEKKLQDAYLDKDCLMLEMNKNRRNNKNIKIIEDQLSSEIEENSVLTRKLSEITKKFEVLSKAHNESLLQKKLLEDSLFLADNQSSASVSNFSQIPSLELEELQVKNSSLERELARLKLENKELESQLELHQQLKSFGTSSEAIVLKYSRLECEFLEARINFSTKMESLNSQVSEYKNLLLEANHSKDLTFVENNELKEKNTILEKQTNENTQIVTRLRQENVKLRENIDRLKVNLELDAAKKENNELKKEISKLKGDISENFQTNLSLRTENKFLYDQLEMFKNATVAVNQSSSEIVKTDCLPLNDIISCLQRMIDFDDLKFKLVDYIFELKKTNKVVSLESQQMLEKINLEKNKLSLELQEESKRRFEAERKNFAFLKQLRHYEELR